MTARLNSLQQQLQGFDQLKDSIARNEIELGTALRGILAELKSLLPDEMSDSL
jgi:hypothetical protein